MKEEEGRKEGRFYLGGGGGRATIEGGRFPVIRRGAAEEKIGLNEGEAVYR
jgi:hypothetical protein